jgi:DNA-binding CsgD family transcriptional regulator
MLTARASMAEMGDRRSATASDVPAKPSHPQLGRSLALVGRGEECRRLDELLDVVRAHGGQTLVIVGEPGIGKTALLRYSLAAAADFHVQRAAGAESEMEFEFAVLQQLCAPMLHRFERLPEPQREALAVALGRSAGPAPDRFTVGLAVLSLLSAASAERPLVCVIDDTHWADRPSVQALTFAARHLVDKSVAILFATRHLTRELQRLPGLRVGGLDDDAARTLLLSAVSGPLDERVRERIVAETHGNPLALLDISRGLSTTVFGGGFEGHDAQALPRRIEASYRTRMAALPRDLARLLLLAAAEPLGDPVLLRRAALRLGLDFEAISEAEPAGLISSEEKVTFRHPLVRSAIYGSAALDDRRAVHRALAEATDPETDPDRRAWHLAEGAAGPDEQVALELERSARRAQMRGGAAAAAALLKRAVALSLDPARRVERALAAAQASLQAGAFDAARALLWPAESGTVDELKRARAALLHAQIASASSRGGDSPALLIGAARRLEALDPGLARSSYLEALSAALFAGRLAAAGGGAGEVAHAVQAAVCAGSGQSATDLLLDGWAALFTAGRAAAEPTLQAALAAFTEGNVAAEELQLLWLATITAPVIWDETRWDALSLRHVEVARNNGVLSELPLALNSRSYIHLFRGEFDIASTLIGEAAVAVDATSASLTPWGEIALAALRGRTHEASPILDLAAADATARGEGISLTVVAWARALLHNGLGEYDTAFAAAQDAIACPTNSAATAWGMVELIEAADRLGESDAAREAADRFSVIAETAGTDWALGVNARSLAVTNAGDRAERLYREAIDRLQRCGMRVELGRAHLVYGEWLRRENRRVDARAQLRSAYELFSSIGMEAFAGRAGHELLATGETVRKRRPETRDDLTPQERQIAELASDGLSNPEIGARLFLSRRTVEWHLRKVFAKLDVSSRRELATALDDRIGVAMHPRRRALSRAPGHRSHDTRSCPA